MNGVIGEDKSNQDRTGLSMKLVNTFHPTHVHTSDGVEYEVLDYPRVKCFDEYSDIHSWKNGVLYRNKENLLCVRTLENFNERFTKL